MKQHITVEQLKELDEKGKKKLREWWKIKDGNIYWFPKDEERNEGTAVFKYGMIPDDKDTPLLSIGQMIEFLGENWYHRLFYFTTVTGGYGLSGLMKRYDGEFCDALWMAVKEVLNEKVGKERKK